MWSFLSEDVFLKSVRFNDHTNVWPIDFCKEFLSILEREQRIVLGGDIIGQDFQYTHDSWYYNIDRRKTHEENVISSIQIACKYIENYIERNGIQYYVDVVISPNKIE